MLKLGQTLILVTKTNPIANGKDLKTAPESQAVIQIAQNAAGHQSQSNGQHPIVDGSVFRQPNGDSAEGDEGHRGKEPDHVLAHAEECTKIERCFDADVILDNPVDVLISCRRPQPGEDQVFRRQIDGTADQSKSGEPAYARSSPGFQ